MQDLENLSSEVETYPCLYDSSSVSYKEMILKKYAQARVDDWASFQ